MQIDARVLRYMRIIYASYDGTLFPIVPNCSQYVVGTTYAITYNMNTTTTTRKRLDNDMNTTHDTNKLNAIIKRYANDKKRAIHQIQFTFNVTNTRAIELYNNATR